MTKENSDTFSLLQENLRQARLAEAVQLLANLRPVISSGPFVTMANDLSGIVIYLSISSAFLRYTTP